MILSLACGLWLLLGARPAAAETPPSRARFGVTTNQNLWDYPRYTALGIGWYHNWWSHPIGFRHVPGVKYYPMIGAWDDLWGTETGALLRSYIAAVPESYPPGTVWIIGNEPQYDVYTMANGAPLPGGPRTLTPDEYAQKYKKYHDLVKALDPSYRVATAALFDNYLGQVRAAYEARYGARMPVDVYNIHAYLNTTNPNDPADLLRFRVEHMRRMMADYGDHDKPLIISELGALSEADDPRVPGFMRQALDYLSTATSSTLGCPSDGGRLVQRWAWFTLTRYHNAQDPDRWRGTDLLDRLSGELTPLGQLYAAYLKGPERAPHAFSGHVTLDGYNVPGGFPVSAWISGTQVAQTAAIITGGASYYALAVPADDPETASLEGGVEGAQVRFRVGAALVSATGVWQNGATTALDLNATGDIGSWQSIDIPLVAGWNLISVPFAPASPLITQALATIDGHYDLLYAYDAAPPAHWRTYNAAAPAFLNTLREINERMGLWVRVDMSVTLSIAGTPPPTTTQALVPGWNLVGYPSTVTRPLTEALASIAGKYDLVYTYEAALPAPWRKYNIAAPPFLNTLREFTPGRGYWVHMTAAGDWTP